MLITITTHLSVISQASVVGRSPTSSNIKATQLFAVLEQTITFIHDSVRQFKLNMELCRFCETNPKTDHLVKCCQEFICLQCKDKYQRLAVCHCQKNINKKWCEPQPKLFGVIQDFKIQKPQQCHRCDSTDVVRYCENCQAEFCIECSEDIHSVGTYKLHNTTVNTNPRRIMETRKNNPKQQICSQHRLKKDYICECNYISYCVNCIKIHRDTCIRKSKLLSEYRKQYFTSMLNKLDFITECKNCLKKTNLQCEEHFNKQKVCYQHTKAHIEETFIKLQKLIEFKKNEVKKNVDQYWAEFLVSHLKTLENIKNNQKQYDDFARLVEKFSEKLVGLDYLQKHVNKKHFQFQAFSFKITGLDNVQRQILSLSTNYKKIQSTTTQNPTQSTSILRARKGSMTNIQNPMILSQINQDPLLPRPLTLLASSSEIHYQFLHLPYQKQNYQIEFGVGFKSKGQEVFKRVKASENGKGIIKGLNSGTIYRLRMRVVNGSWGPISEIVTLQPTIFPTLQCPFAKSDNKGTIMFLKSGTLYSNNGIQFGVHIWEIKIVVDKNSHSESETACISIGISNKQAKKAIFIGTTINYGYQRQNLKLKVCVDVDNNRMVITNDKQQQQVYQNLPELPMYPTLINKGNSTVQLFITF